MGGMFGGAKPQGPTPAQLAAQEQQRQLAEAEAARLARQTQEEEAARRARAGRGGGRSLLLLDEVGITDEERAPKKTLGG